MIKLSLITLIRNEQDILNVFLDHIDALFDEVYLLDHRSIDYSSKILINAANLRKGFRYIKVELNGHYQKEMSTILMHHLFENGADYVFFLDCDEFFIFKNRNELEQLILELGEKETIGSVRWINGFPLDLSNSHLNYFSKLWISSEESPFSKVIIPRSAYEKYNKKLSIIQGNHLALDEDGKPLETKEIGQLVHIPIRSKEQLISKVIRSSLSDFSRITKMPGESYQYKEMLKLIMNSKLSDDEIRGCINLYQKEGKILLISKQDLKRGNWIKTCIEELNIARTNKFKFRFTKQNANQINLQIIADHIFSLENENPEDIVFLDSESKISLRKGLT